MAAFTPNSPDRDEVVLRIMDAHVTLSNWTHYSFNSHFLTPADAFHFTVGDNQITDEVREALTLGARVRLTLNNVVLADGHIDSVEIKADRSTGIVYDIAGRDRLGLAVDSVADPTKQFKEGQTLADALKDIFGPFGWLSDDSFVIDNSASRDLRTGATRGTKSGHSKKHFGEPLKSIVLHQLKPHNHEGVFNFASRICQRFGLWIWASADGEKLIVGKPDFTQEPLYQLQRTADGGTNVLRGSAHLSMSEQPTVIIADGFSGLPEFGKGRIKSICVNPYFGVDADGFVLPEVSALLQKFPNVTPITLVTQPFRRREVNLPLRPMYLHDDESKTQLQLDNFVRREMSLLMRKSLVCHYTVEGHGQVNPDGEFVAWATDTVVDVQDDVTDVHERMYVLSCTYTKSRSGGTHTDLELIRLNSIQFDEQATKEAKAMGNTNPKPTKTEKRNDPVVRNAAIDTVSRK